MIDQFLAEHAYTANTEDRYRRALSLILTDLDLGSIGSVELRRWLEGRITWGSSTRWVAYCAIRKYIRWRYGPGHPALALKIRRVDGRPQRSLSERQAMDLLASFDLTTPKGARDLALASLMLDAGLRSSEICSLELQNLDMDQRHLFVLVKGQRWAEGVFSQHTARNLDWWLAHREGIARDNTVFVSVGGLTPGRRLTRDGLRCIVRRWGERIGVTLSPHDLRRTFAVLSTRAGAPARVLQVAGRWSSLEMVERYTRAIQATDFEPYFSVSRILD